MKFFGKRYREFFLQTADLLALHVSPVIPLVPAMLIPTVHPLPVCGLQMKYQIFLEKNPCFWIFFEEGSLFFHFPADDPDMRSAMADSLCMGNAPFYGLSGGIPFHL